MAASSAAVVKDIPRFKHEFGGAIGTASTSLLLPIVPYFLYFFCNPVDGCLSLQFSLSAPFVQTYVPNPFRENGSFYKVPLWDWRVFAFYLTWWAFQASLHILIPAEIHLGAPLPGTKQKRLPYRINAFKCLLATLVTAFTVVYLGLFPATYLYDNFLALISSMFVFSVLLSVFLYFHAEAVLAEAKKRGASPDDFPEAIPAYNTGVFSYDFFLGRLMNPRIGNFDLKCFCELRPGMMLWLLLNLSMGAKAVQQFGYLPIANALVIIFHAVYVFDALHVEEAVLTTMDITTEGFGYMLGFGDHAWLPCVYSFQARYLADHHIQLSPHFAALMIGFKLLGMYIFRASNSEKNSFRNNPDDESVKHIKFIETKRGTKLIVNSWWGLSRHINYCGDLIMGLSYCMPCGWEHGHILCYFYIIYFGILLIHRERRDNEACHVKYGKDWEEYCKKVPYRIFPYIY